MEEEVKVYTYNSEEFAYVGELLRGVFQLVTLDGSDNELLASFIEAMEHADMIVCDDDGAFEN